MFYGLNYKWFEGVVEDRFDPLDLGRVRVRVMGIHSDQKAKNDVDGIPTDELLWMHPMMPITSASMSGIGQSPTGLVEGSHVVGYFRDKFCQDGVIIGSLPGIYKNKPDSSKGFSDPNGQYPRYVGNDVNILAGGGQAGSGGTGSGAMVGEDGTPLSVYTQNENAGIAIKPDDTPVGDYVADDDPNFTIEEMLVQDEGVRNKWYLDSEGYPTIGIGHLIIHQNTSNLVTINSILSAQLGRVVTGGTITKEEISKLFAQDLNKVRADIMRFTSIAQVYMKANRSRQMAIENMCFQMGAGGLAKFKNTLAAMAREDWPAAYSGLRDSLWARQTPGRSARVAKIILTGNLESYGVMVPDAAPKLSKRSKEDASGSTASFKAVDVGDDPENPPVEAKSRIMFEEPKSSYGAQYPYNHVYESESGHIQEFDDTPGKERYHRKHPTGTFEEIRPDGSRLIKIVGEDYLIVKNGRNVNVKGNLKVVIEGNAELYYMGNVTQTVDGNMTQLIRGNVTETIDGNVFQTVHGNVDESIDGNVNQLIKGNVGQSIDGNVTQRIKGNQTANVDGDYKLSVKGNYDVAATGNAKMKGANATMEAQGTAQISGATINMN
ncbi:baseplate hub subunit and tail lysozyme [Aeromonas phage AsFcp_4]|uniref:Baseplate central spike protein n=1 Tax=Aeromonas phage PX29 TaxID=926067 RepID=E5DQC3_9CAUD|nr:baseplate hub subunit and tail lysozyme [Aeromonas phage PX29]ADQ52909.1 gp5 baseplate hub subunit and tail lysozyme [Aeromonas phage PX29]QAX99483.1 baseplate hub subunit and tail lysozyme [Aeromonas phage AsFcp_4]